MRDFTPQRQKLAHRTLRFMSEVVFPPSSRKQSAHNCTLYMVKSSFVWRKRLAARIWLAKLCALVRRAPKQINARERAPNSSCKC